MALKSRKTARSLREDLYLQPYHFEFTQAVRLMHLLKRHAPPLGTSGTPEREALTLKSRVFLSAPPSDLFQIKVSAETKAGEDHAFDFEKQPPPPEVFVNFLGIAGVQGPLPLPYTEDLLDKLRQKDTVFRDFLDIFNHRILSLYYRIEQKFNPSLSLSTPEETPVGNCLKALTGWTDEKNKLPFSSRNLLLYAGFLWQKPHSPQALRLLITSYFQVPVSIDSFQGAWIPLPKTEKTYLGRFPLGQQNILGEGAVLGQRVWCQHQGILVKLRFKQFDLFQRFLPNGDSFSLLTGLIAHYLGPAFSFQIGLSLDLKPQSCLGGTSPFYLGWTSWVGRGTTEKSAPLPLRDKQVVLFPYNAFRYPPQ